jgi:hypothetical protein
VLKVFMCISDTQVLIPSYQKFTHPGDYSTPTDEVHTTSTYFLYLRNAINNEFILWFSDF